MVTGDDGHKKMKKNVFPSQLPALGLEVNGQSNRIFCSLHLAVSVYGSNQNCRRFCVNVC